MSYVLTAGKEDGAVREEEATSEQLSDGPQDETDFPTPPVSDSCAQLNTLYT